MPETEIAFRADRLKALREQQGLSQRDLSQRCGVGDSQISKYEKGISDPMSTTVKALASALDVSIDYLLGATDDPRGHLGDGFLNDDEAQMVNVLRAGGWPAAIKFGVDRWAESSTINGDHN